MISLRSLSVFLLFVAVFAGASVSAQQAEQQQPADQPAPVIVDGRTLFSVNERILSFSPLERATLISQRINQLVDQPRSVVFPIQVVDSETTTEIAAQDLVIMAVTDADARRAGVSRQELARQYADLIETTIDSLRSEHSLQTIGLAILYSLVATALLLLIVRTGGAAYGKLMSQFEATSPRWLPSLRIQKVELVSAGQISGVVRTVLYLLRHGLTVLLLYFYVSAVFGFFPQTRGYGAVLLGYALSPLRSLFSSLIAKLPDLIFVIVAILVSYYFTKLIKSVFVEIGRGRIKVQGFYSDWADPTYKIIRFAIIALTVAVVLPFMPGYQSPAFQGVSIFVGVLFSLSSTAAVSNIVAGLALTYTRGFQVGDRVKIGETVGDVMQKTLLVTRIRTIKNVDIAIPNSLVLANHMVNFSSSAERHGLILHTTVTIGYDTPWQKVHQLLIEAAASTENILDDPAPFVLQTSLDDCYVSYELNGYTKKPNVMAVTYSQLHANIQESFNKAGVEIMSPEYSAIRDGNEATIPAEHRKPDHARGAFRVSVETAEELRKVDSVR